MNRIDFPENSLRQTREGRPFPLSLIRNNGERGTDGWTKNHAGQGEVKGDVEKRLSTPSSSPPPPKLGGRDEKPQKNVLRRRGQIRHVPQARAIQADQPVLPSPLFLSLFSSGTP